MTETVVGIVPIDDLEFDHTPNCECKPDARNPQRCGLPADWALITLCCRQAHYLCGPHKDLMLGLYCSCTSCRRSGIGEEFWKCTNLK